ncbi:nucleotidyl transferase AbiEii/AbiGii toxin family protein [Candidatus Micrarchaeota archaeon]|nr:nucleotidyl transferase AbiEii/AbiGii toxin family protein [Candidatus Micrarchaeota archaeon]
MKIPLANKLRRRIHLETAMLQDEVLEIVYSLESNAILHGGTCIWRCYAGNRFSEDLDFYFKITEQFETGLRKKLKERDLLLLKYKKTSNLLFSKISDGNIEVRLEVNLSPKKLVGVVRPYEKIDGSYVDIFTLSPEDLILEKISAYQSRKLIRDIYDIYHLSKYVQKEDQFKSQLLTFLNSIQKPIDEPNLKAIVYTGAIPSFKQILEYLNSRFSK